jgi:hypothetical protein
MSNQAEQQQHARGAVENANQQIMFHRGFLCCQAIT